MAKWSHMISTSTQCPDLADATRRSLLDELFKQDGQRLSSLERRLPITRFGVMKHLRVARGGGLVTTRVPGRQRRGGRRRHPRPAPGVDVQRQPGEVVGRRSLGELPQARPALRPRVSACGTALARRPSSPASFVVLRGVRYRLLQRQRGTLRPRRREGRFVQARAGGRDDLLVRITVEGGERNLAGDA